jgi:putative addiction module component (TIGR02574 family)
MQTMPEIMSRALELPRSDRSYLASKLIESLDETEGLSPEWQQEIRERVARREAGETQHISKEELHRDIEKILG